MHLRWIPDLGGNDNLLPIQLGGVIDRRRSVSRREFLRLRPSLFAWSNGCRSLLYETTFLSSKLRRIKTSAFVLGQNRWRLSLQSNTLDCVEFGLVIELRTSQYFTSIIRLAAKSDLVQKFIHFLPARQCK